MIEKLERRQLLTTIVVNSNSDHYWPPDGPVMTLVMAMNTADKSSTPTTITFTPDIQYITQVGAGFLIGGNQPISIVGPPTGLTIDNNNIGVAFFINGDVTLTNINIVNASQASVFNLGASTLTLDNVNFSTSNGFIVNYGTIYYDTALSNVVNDIKDQDIRWNDPTYAINARANGYVDLGNTIEIKYTLYGDSNLDGTVDFTDFMRMTQHFTQTGVGWAQGDFNGDGTVDNADFLLLKANYGLQDPPGTGLAPVVPRTGPVPVSPPATTQPTKAPKVAKIKKAPVKNRYRNSVKLRLE